eukprot:112454-Chlamydomonas_euryale.AAC.2
MPSATACGSAATRAGWAGVAARTLADEPRARGGLRRAAVAGRGLVGEGGGGAPHMAFRSAGMQGIRGSRATMQASSQASKQPSKQLSKQAGARRRALDARALTAAAAAAVARRPQDHAADAAGVQARLHAPHRECRASSITRHANGSVPARKHKTMSRVDHRRPVRSPHRPLGLVDAAPRACALPF